jgi:hypothetical protein
VEYVRGLFTDSLQPCIRTGHDRYNHRRTPPVYRSLASPASSASIRLNSGQTTAHLFVFIAVPVATSIAIIAVIFVFVTVITSAPTTATMSAVTAAVRRQYPVSRVQVRRVTRQDATPPDEVNVGAFPPARPAFFELDLFRVLVDHDPIGIHRIQTMAEIVMTVFSLARAMYRYMYKGGPYHSGHVGRNLVPNGTPQRSELKVRTHVYMNAGKCQFPPPTLFKCSLSHTG